MPNRVTINYGANDVAEALKCHCYVPFLFLFFFGGGYAFVNPCQTHCVQGQSSQTDHLPANILDILGFFPFEEFCPDNVVSLFLRNLEETKKGNGTKRKRERRKKRDEEVGRRKRAATRATLATLTTRRELIDTTICDAVN